MLLLDGGAVSSRLEDPDFEIASARFALILVCPPGLLLLFCILAVAPNYLRFGQPDFFNRTSAAEMRRAVSSHLEACAIVTAIVVVGFSRSRREQEMVPSMGRGPQISENPQET